MKHSDYMRKDVGIIGLCQYPLKEWRELEKPFFTTYGWWFFAMVMMYGARDADQASSMINLLWKVRDMGGNDYIIKEKGKKWINFDPNMPSTIDEFRKKYRNACTGFLPGEEDSKADRAIEGQSWKRAKGQQQNRRETPPSAG